MLVKQLYLVSYMGHMRCMGLILIFLLSKWLSRYLSNSLSGKHFSKPFFSVEICRGNYRDPHTTKTLNYMCINMCVRVCVQIHIYTCLLQYSLQFMFPSLSTGVSALLNEDHHCIQSLIKIPTEIYLKFCLTIVYMRLLLWNSVKYPKELRL